MAWPAIDPGILRHRVQIQSQSTEKDSVGQKVDTWNAVRETCAEIHIATGKEIYQSGQFSSQVSHVVTVRWGKVAIAAGMRVLFTDNSGTDPIDHYYLIQWIDNLEHRNVILKLYCLEINASE